MRRLFEFGLIVALVVACTGTGSVGDVFILDDGSIHGPHDLATGPQTVEISNVGEFNHTLVFTDQDGNVVAATDVVPPGANASLDVDLPTGEYLVSCRLVTESPDGSILDHFEVGMWQNLEVEG